MYTMYTMYGMVAWCELNYMIKFFMIIRLDRIINFYVLSYNNLIRPPDISCILAFSTYEKSPEFRVKSVIV